MISNLFDAIPDEIDEEIVTDLLRHENLRIERIVSRGHCSAAGDWYDQAEHEWVVLLEGAATIVYQDGQETRLQRGDTLNIPAHQKHRVSWTDPDQVTIWLAIFYT